jgi:hypothetical protein
MAKYPGALRLLVIFGGSGLLWVLMIWEAIQIYRWIGWLLS